MDKKFGEQFLEDMKQFGTKIFLSDKLADKYFRKFFDLTDNELHKVKSYSIDRRMFLFKQDDLSLILTMDLSEMPEELQILVT
jgi:type IV secretory pathway VirB4 component